MPWAKIVDDLACPQVVEPKHLVGPLGAEEVVRPLARDVGAPEQQIRAANGHGDWPRAGEIFQRQKLVIFD